MHFGAWLKITNWQGRQQKVTINFFRKNQEREKTEVTTWLASRLNEAKGESTWLALFSVTGHSAHLLILVEHHPLKQD